MSEFEVRLEAFRWLRDKGKPSGGIFLGTELARGFEHQGRRVTLKGATGIWFPQGFEMPISITTRENGPYRLDDIGDDGTLTYAYRRERIRITVTTSGCAGRGKRAHRSSTSRKSPATITRRSGR